MKPYELDIMLDCLDNSVKHSWEQARYICYTTVQSQSTKKLKPEDIMNFTWDKKEEKRTTTVTKEERERLTAKAKKIMKEKTI